MNSNISLPEKGDMQADFQSLEQAAEWYAMLYVHDASAEQQRAWSQWFDERPEHRLAWQHIEAVSRRFAPLREEGERDAAAVAMDASVKHRQGRRQTLRTLAAFALTSMAGWMAWRYTPLQNVVAAFNAEYRTGTGDLRDIKLADGTRVWLNTSSALDIDFSGSHRLLTLRQGEMLIDTADDDQHRPFYVQTRFGRMQALGTRFTVRQEEEHTVLSVFDGRVLIRNLAGQEEIVVAGNQRHFSAMQIDHETTADGIHEAWIRRVILANDIPLEQFISELSRYQRSHINVHPQVAGLRVVGRFPTDNPEKALAMLERDLPVRVRHVLPWWITVEAR